jgi:hypothetical protein
MPGCMNTVLMSLSVVTLGMARAIALGMPEAVEAEHWGNPSFRIYGRIFATVPDPHHLNVMIDPFDAEAVVNAAPSACSVLHWGKEVRGVRVDLRAASAALVGDLLEAAWRRRAPKRLVAAGQVKRRGGDADHEAPTRR